MTPFAYVAAAKLAPLLAREAAAARPAAIAWRCWTSAAAPGRCSPRCAAIHPSWRFAGMDASAGMLAAARAKAPLGSVTWARGAADRAAVRRRVRRLHRLLRHAQPSPRRGGAGTHVRRPRHRLAPGWPAGLRRHQPPRLRGVVGKHEPVQPARAGRCSSTRASIGANAIATGHVKLERAGLTQRFVIHERYFGREEVAAGLDAAGFAAGDRTKPGPPSRSGARERPGGWPGARPMTPFGYKSTRDRRSSHANNASFRSNRPPISVCYD